MPPTPEILWQNLQPLSWKTFAPSAMGPLVTPTTEAGKGGAFMRGDHGATSPSAHEGDAPLKNLTGEQDASQR